MKAVDTTDPFSTIKRQISNKKNHEVPTSFVKKTWWEMRGMDASGKFVPEDESKHDEWKQKAKSDRLVKKYAGEAFADTKLDYGLHSIVDKTESQEEKDLIKMQRVMGAMGHLTLKAMEGYSTVYNKLTEFVNAGIGSLNSRTLPIRESRTPSTRNTSGQSARRSLTRTFRTS